METTSGPALTIYVRDDGSTVHAGLSKFDGAASIPYVPAERLREATDVIREALAILAIRDQPSLAEASAQASHMLANWLVSSTSPRSGLSMNEEDR